RAADAQQLSRFVGRTAELDRLHHLLELARAGEGQVAAVSSEAGVGKTRLVYELLRSATTESWRVLDRRGPSHQRAACDLPIIEMLRTYFELDACHPASRVAERVASTLRDLDPGLVDATAPILSLLDALPPDDPLHSLDARERRKHVLDALVRLIV